MKATHYFRSGLAILAASVLSTQAGLLATSLNGTTVVYSNVTETISGTGTGTTSGTYGAPTVSGDGIDFTPTNLLASATGGQTQETDANLIFTIAAKDGYHITDLDFSEAGDIRLYGAGGATTFGTVSATFFIDVLEVDGDTPINENGNQNEFIAYFSLPGDPGVNNWSKNMMLDIQGILDDNNVDYDFGATLVQVQLDNLMYVSSEVGTTAIVQKKDLDGFSVTAISIPEPASAGLMVGMAGVAFFVRRRFIG